MNAEAEEAAPPAPEPKNASTEQAADGPAEVRARATSKREPSRGGVIEWLWGGSAMKAARRGGVAPNEAELEAQRQANLCVELARNALEPLQPLEFGPAYAPACELYREAIYWGLRAAGGVAKTEPAPPFEQLWDASERAALLRAAGDSASNLDGIAQALKGKDFVHFAELPPAEARELATTLRHFAESLVDALNPAQLEVERIWSRRMTRVGALLAVAVVALVGSVFALDARERARDVAVGKPWEVSTRWGEGCTSPEQVCEKSPLFFFHTLEENDPWLIIDLNESTRISAVRVENRLDCCQERAIPLVVEVSSDRQNWSEVARRTTDFSSWKATFAPVQARYVKLHVPRVTNLHFKRVRVLR